MSNIMAELNKFSREKGATKIQIDYLNLLKRIKSTNTVILDAGCGERGIYTSSKLNCKNNRKTIIGIDVEKKNNKFVDKQYAGNLEKLPFKENTFDLIICEWVVEHLKNPEKVFREFTRVTKTGGKLVIITPNSKNMLVLIGKIVPSWFKDFLYMQLLHHREEDLFPVYLRANKRSSLNKLADKSKMREIMFKTYPNPEYFRWSKVILRFVLWFERATKNIKSLKPFDMYILAAYQIHK